MATRSVGGGCLTPLQRYSRCILQPQATWPLVQWLGGCLTPLQRYSRCILQPQATWPLVQWVGGVLPLCRDIVGVFYSPRRRGHSFSGWVGCLTPLQRYSRCILQPQATWPLVQWVGGALPLCRDIVGVFYSLSRLGHSLWGNCVVCVRVFVWCLVYLHTPVRPADTQNIPCQPILACKLVVSVELKTPVIA